MAVALVRWGDFETAGPIFEAVTMGQLDRWLTAPGEAGDEEFHRNVGRDPRGVGRPGRAAGSRPCG